MRIVYASSEMAPYAKTGGLADVSAALPKALAARGHEVTCFLPRYGSIPFPPGRFIGSVHVPVDSLHRSAGFYESEPSAGLRVIFVEHPPFFDRSGLYGDAYGDFGDNAFRFAFFCRAVLEFCRSRGYRPDVIHAHDWQTGLLPVYLKAFYGDDPTLHRVPTVFTVHNLAYQGHFSAETLGPLGLPDSLATEDALEWDGHICYMKGGLLFAEMVTTVSPTYAREIQTPEFGQGLEVVVRSRSADLVGILNGVDYQEWDPRHDPHIAAPFDEGDHVGKVACKRALLAEFGLATEPDLPLIGIISRLVYQKGFDLVAAGLEPLLARRLRLVALGTGEPEVEEGLREFARRDPSRFGVRFEYDQSLAHRIEAGADMLLIPSRFEPCGLTQLYSMRYGTIPIVRATGGLVDTVQHFDARAKAGTGFVFEYADLTGLLWAIDEALSAYARPGPWSDLMRRAMTRDFSWGLSAERYEAVYSRDQINV
ncbi:MAG: glycogen synthase GlgA [Vicinamibacteria bacterium]|nr:glycogen synthase GlgA [Vicinamibacteria bacterium]